MGARMQVCPERIAAMIEELGSRMTPTGTVYADNGEVDISFVDGRVVLDVREERPAGEDRVAEQRVRLNLLMEDTAKLGRLVDCVLSCRRAARWSETALAGMAWEVGR